MIAQGQNYPTIVTQDSSGSFSFGNLPGIEQLAGGGASGALNTAASFNKISAKTYNFNIPAGATITGIVVEINRNSSQLDIPNSRFILDQIVQLLKAGSPIGNNKANTSAKWDNTKYNTIAYGSPSDLWGTSWTPADINNANFGVLFQVQGDDESGGTTSANIDFIRVTVYYTLTTNPYSVSINGVDRTKDVIAQTMHIEDVLNDRQSTCYFMLMDRFANGWPDNEQEVIITDAYGNRAFGGIIVKRAFQPKSNQGYGMPVVQINCQDYIRLLDKNLVAKDYLNMTDQAVIQDIVTTFAPGSGIDTSNVGLSTTISELKFNYMQPSQALRKITDNTGYNWYIDYFKKLFYFPNNQNTAPFSIDDTTDNKVTNLLLTQDNSQLRNRVYVRGSTRLSDLTTFTAPGDSTTTQFLLPAKPHTLTVKVNGVTKSLGIVNVDTSGFDWYVDYDNKYIVQDVGGVVLTSSDTLEVDFTYYVPIIVVIEDSASIAEFGAHEYVIQDNTITTSQAASDRGSAELNDYGGTLNEGTFSTFTPGLRSGQIITITSAAYGVSAQQYVIQKVIASPIGGGNFRYDITLASAKTMGIIRFLVEMLETQQNLVDVSNNEVIDNLKTLSDTITESDNISKTTDVASKNWATSSSDHTDANWDLFQWS